MRRPLLVTLALAGTLLQAIAGEAPDRTPWKLDPDKVGRSTRGLRLPERELAPQTSRGWQFASAFPGPKKSMLLAASDGVYWYFELRVLVPPEGTSTVGLIFGYEDPRSYGVLLWNTASGSLTLRSLRHGQSIVLTTSRVPFRGHNTNSVVLRSVMGNLVSYVNGIRALRSSGSAILGRVAVFRGGNGGLGLDGVEVRALSPESQADVFSGRSIYEAKCAMCHELMGPWNSHYVPDEWESVVNEMLNTEHADKVISRSEANRIIDYLRIISLCPDHRRYRPRV